MLIIRAHYREDFLKILKKQHTARTLKSEVCCGMPKFELGDLESVENLL